jgi:pimeloyl-ACP methyl ester carboxylesterase
MLDADHIRAISAPVLVISGEQDWMDWRTYGPQAAAAHKARHDHGATFFLAKGADRGLMLEQDERVAFHKGARQAIKSWLTAL